MDIEHCIVLKNYEGTIGCRFCKDGYYPSEPRTQCIKNPGEGESGYIEGCKFYIVTSGNLECDNCDGRNHYGMVNS